MSSSSSTALLDHVQTLREPLDSTINPAQAAEDDAVQPASVKTSLDLEIPPLRTKKPPNESGQTAKDSPSQAVARTARPNYSTGLTAEQLKRPPRERLNALLTSSNPSPPISPVPIDSHPRTAILATPYGKESITPPKRLKEPPEQTATTSSAHSSSRSSPVAPAAGMTHTSALSKVTRAPSLDSTMSKSSTISSTTGPHTPSTSVDLPVPTDAEPSSLIAASGSAESVVQRLMKEKQVLASRNEQLWKLVEKQRAMILGLNKDLDKLVKDRERYRRKLKEQEAQEPASSIQDAAAKSSNRSEALQSSRHVVTGSVDSTASSQLMPSDLTLRNPLRQRADKVNQTTDDPSDPDQDQGQKRPVPAPLPLRVDKLPRPGSSESAWTPKSNPASPDVSSPGGTKKKAPPTPLNLTQISPPRTTSGTQSVQPQRPLEGARDAEISPDLDRGRRRTREDDDRAVSGQSEEDQRSRSKKDKSSKSKGRSQPPTELQNEPKDPKVTELLPGLANGVGLPSSPRAPLLGGLQSPLQNANMGSLAAMLGSRENPQVVSSAPNLHTLSALKSPGLPMSPRPGNRPPTAPPPRAPQQFVQAPLMSPGPMSARGGLLSPRPPRQPIPLPPSAQFGTTNPHLARAETYANPQSSIAQPVGPTRNDSSQSVASTASGHVGPVYRGFMSNDFPNLLLPPPALNFVDVETCSSRMRPPSHSLVPNKTADDDLVFTLAIHARSDGKQLWRVEKTVHALHALDQSLRHASSLPAKLPDKTLFAGHAPVKVDQRRAALDEYFAIILGCSLDDAAVSSLCNFLSTDVTGPKVDRSSLSSSGSSATFRQKEGFLAKKGKSFGGWKARYFILDGRDLQYYDNQGGPHLGTIRLHKAQIAYQNAETSSEDSEYRHAFMILEQKRDESSNLIRHILCAENDQERDGWMVALKACVDVSDGPYSPHVGSGSPKQSGSISRTAKAASARTDTPSQSVELQSVGYDQTVPAAAPTMGGPASSTPSDSPIDNVTAIGIPSITPGSERPAISGPVAGGPIQNASAWGNKTLQSKRNIFGFKSKNSEENAGPPTPRILNGTHAAMQQHYGRPVFGMPLAEAVELFPPSGVDICLPAPIYRCIEWMEVHNAAQEQGLFRQSGSQTGIVHLKEKFNREGDVNLLEDDTLDCHTIASVFKMYLRELPESVLTKAMHLDFLKVLGTRLHEHGLPFR